MNLLIEAIKAKASQKDVKRLNKILKEQNGNLDKSYNKIQQLQKKLVLQEIKNQASKDELSDTKRILQKLQREKQKYDNKVREQNNEISEIKRLIKQAKNRIKKENKKACMMEKGMTQSEIQNTIGYPTAKDYHYSTSKFNGGWYYGNIKLSFGQQTGILGYKSGCR